MNIGKLIKQLRKDTNVSRKTLAENIGVDVRMISYWESGTNEPKASYVYKLAVFFGVSADYLLGLED